MKVFTGSEMLEHFGGLAICLTALKEISDQIGWMQLDIQPSDSILADLHGF